MGLPVMALRPAFTAPGKYTNIAHYLPWIEAVTGDTFLTASQH